MMARVADDNNPLGRTHTVLMLRWVLIVATSYLVVFSRPLADNPASTGLFVAAYFASNIVLGVLLPRYGSIFFWDIVIVLLDTMMVCIGLAISGAASSQFYVVYFLVMFVSALTERLPLIVGAALAISAVHMYVEAIFLGVDHLLTPAHALRVPFLFVVGMFFGHLVEDVRRRERQAYEARAHERRMAFLSAVSHDLKNPLGVLQDLTTLLLEGDAGPLNAHQADLVRRAHATVRHVITYALNLIDAARIEAGRLVLQRRAVNLRDLVQDALSVGRCGAQLKGLHLEVSLAADLPTVELDPIHMERVISNLLGNAIKFTPEGGTISLSVRRAGADVLLAVRDTGPGLSAVPIDFETYRRESGYGQRDGSGLGLLIVTSIVQAHGGTVDLRGRPGEGTTVTIRLPAVARPSVARAAAVTPPRGGVSWQDGGRNRPPAPATSAVPQPR